MKDTEHKGTTFPYALCIFYPTFIIEYEKDIAFIVGMPAIVCARYGTGRAERLLSCAEFHYETLYLPRRL